MANPERVPTLSGTSKVKWNGLSKFLEEKCTLTLYSAGTLPLYSKLPNYRWESVSQVVMHDRDKFSCHRL